MKKSSKSRVLSLVLAIVMMAGMLSMSAITAFAAGEGTYTITFDANGGTGTMEPVEVAIGTKYTVRGYKSFCDFTPPEGKSFDGWARYPNGTGKFSDGEKISGSQTLYAVWESARKITIIPSEHGSITTASAEAYPHTVVQFEAHPEPGYKLKEWKVVSGNVYTGGGDFRGEFVMQYTDVTVTAVFEKAYTLTITTNGSFDSFDISEMTEDYVVGTPIPMIPGERFSANVPFTYSGSSYGFVKWEVVSGDMVLEDAYNINAIFEMPESDVELRAVYDRNFTTYVSSGEGHGTVSLNGHSSLTVTTGVTYDVVAVPDDGYYLAGFKVRSAGGGYERSNYPFKRRSNNGYSFVAGTDAQYIIADFKPIGGEGWVGPTSCEITLVSGEGYTVEKCYANASTTVEYDRSFYVKVIIHDGYAKCTNFAVLANGVEIASEPDFYGFDEYPIYGIREDTVVTVRGVEPLYSVTLPETDGVWSYAMEGYSSPVAGGESFRFTLYTGGDYENGEDFAVKANGTVLVGVDDIYTVTDIHENIVITVEGVVLKSNTITILESEGGYAFTRNTEPRLGDTIQITVVADDGYEFSHFNVPTRNVEVTKSGDYYTFEMPRDSVVLQPIFDEAEDPRQVILTESIIQSIPDSDNYLISIEDVYVVLSKETIDTLQYKGGDLKIKVEVSDDEVLTEAQKDIIPVEYSSALLVVNVTASVGSETLHELGGSVTLTVPYDTASIAKDQKIAVYYLPESGEAEVIENIFVGDGYVSFTTDHFSVFALGLVEEEDDLFKTVNITLGSDINVNFYTEAGETTVARFTMDGRTVTVGGELQEDGTYMFVFAGVAPQNLGDTIYAELIDNENVIATKEYSVLEYLNTLETTAKEELGYTQNQYDAMISLIVDLLTYGGAAQTYVTHNTENLVCEGIVPTVFVPLTETDKAINNNGTYVTFNGMTVFFDSVNKLMFRFTAEDLTGVTFKIKVGDGAEAEIGYVQDGENYIITTEGIKATGYDDVYTVTAYKDNVAGATATYSVKSYVYAKQNDVSDMAALAKATYNYGLSAKAFVLAD